MKFNDIKLSFGIIYVGLIVLFTLFSLYFDIADFITSTFGDNIKSVYIYFFFLILFTLPFDFLSNKSLNSYEDRCIKKIVFGNIVLFLIFIIFISIIYFLFNLQNLLLAFVFSILMQLLLLALQGIITPYIFNIQEKSYNDSSLLICANSPSYITMNILRTFRGPKIVVPIHWVEQNEKNYFFHLERFELIKKIKIDLKSIIFSISLNSILFSGIYYYFLNSEYTVSSSIIYLSLISNLISFLYILILPKISQNGIINIDSIMKNKDMNLFKENLEIFENYQDKNESRNKAVETIFYPIPSIETRINVNEKRLGLPNVSRLIIFFASFNLSIIFKGVHGNAGKPENWILPPSE